MADIADRAAEREQLDTARAIQARRPEGPPATGRCLNCSHPLWQGRRWCDTDCHADWQARQPGGCR